MLEIKIKVIQSVFREDVMRICNLKEYCGPWQFHSAANVLNSKLVMVFPSRNVRSDVRMDYNHMFCPSEIDSNKKKKQKSLVLCGQVFAQTTETYTIILCPL